MPAVRALRDHLPEYLMEALGLGLFMVSACAFGTLLEGPDSPLRTALSDASLRRALMGLAMGLTAIGLIYSPWGKRSGAHMNPSVTLAFARLGHVKPLDTLFYILFQFAGGLAGVALMARLLGPRLAAPSVRFVATHPGMAGVWPALAAEFVLSLVLMSMVLETTRRARLMRWTGVFAGALIALWITFEAPISGMSLNPARSVASAAFAGGWSSVWIYFVGPPLGMLAAVEVFLFRSGSHQGCAKLDHAPDVRCIFCGQTGARERVGAPPAAGQSPAGTFPRSPALRTNSRPF